MYRVSRRELIIASLAAPRLLAKTRIDRSRISAITDEIARSPEDAIAFARMYRLTNLELRDVPGKRGSNYFISIDEDFLRQAARQFSDNGIRISFLNANLLKYGLPGTEPLRRTPETPELRESRLAREKARFERNEQDLRRSIRSAQILGCPYIRVFTFSRVAEPQTVFPRIAEIVNGFARIAEKEGVKLLIENETSCNVGTCGELNSFLKLIPSKAVGINWDADNGVTMKEPLQEGYALLPKKRLWNVQIKGRSILDYPQKLDWAWILDSLSRDGFKGKIGLETHIFGETQVAKSHESMRAILKLVDPDFVPSST